MQTKTSFHHGANEEERNKHFLEFIQKVSPQADPQSVILFGQILRANHHLMQAAEHRLRVPGFTWAKFRLLMHLHVAEQHGALGGTNPSQLSEMQGISRNTVSSLLNSLEKEGYITRVLHRTDRRRFNISLTPRAKKFMKSALCDQFEYLTECFDEFTPAEREQFLGFLRRLNKSLHTQHGHSTK